MSDGVLIVDEPRSVVSFEVVPAAEELPEIGGYFIAQIANGGYRTVRFSSSFQTFMDGAFQVEVSNWLKPVGND